MMSFETISSWLAVGVLFGMIVALGAAGRYDALDEQAWYDYYCEAVAIWEADAAKGVPVNNRAGWPPYEGECD